MKFISIISILLSLMFVSCRNGDAKQEKKANINSLQLPNEQYGELFEDILSNDGLFGSGKLFNDSKDFLDATPKYPMEVILMKYRSIGKTKDLQQIKLFIHNNFELVDTYKDEFSSTGNINEHIQMLWQHLKRELNERNYGTLIPLNKSYIVPRGWFREIYYWDS